MGEYDLKTLDNLKKAAALEAQKNKEEGEEEGTSAAEILVAGKQGATAANPED